MRELKMKKFMSIFMAISLLMMTGCAATQAQREAQAMQKNATETSSRLNLCIQEMQKLPAVQSIYEGVVVKAEKDGYAVNRFELLRKNDYLSDEQKNNLIIFLIERDKCDQLMLEGASQYNVRIYQKLLEGKTRGDALYQQLINKKINIGEFNTKRIEMRAQEKQELLTIQQQINSDLKYRHDSEVGERNKALQKLSDDNQKLLEERAKAWQRYNQENPMPRSYHTNCYQMGDQIHCTTN